ncbi:MAG: metal ABC transporter ATP-binding protein [Bacteroidota bacterium]|mgnify:CR=1 FL=1
MTTPSCIEFKDVSLGYGTRTIISGVSFLVCAGDFLGIVGPNGSGKTTILRALLGILSPKGGSVVTHDPPGRRLRLGYVPQRDQIDHIMPFTVADVVIMGRYARLGLFRRPGRADHEAVRRSLHHVDIQSLADRSYRDLSGGQKQRVLIARALVAEPDILVLDEPTNGMDLTSRTSILELTKGLHQNDGMTVIMVTHLLSDVANYVSRIAIVEQGQFQVGATSEILTEKNLSQLYRIPVRVAQLEGNTVVLAGGKNV